MPSADPAVHGAALPRDLLMGIRSRLAHWLDPPEQRSLSSWDLLKAGMGGYGFADAAGQIVTHRSAEHALATVTACVNAISSAIASLPAWIHRGDQILEDHPIARMIRRGPNPHQSWSDWLELTISSALLRGNAISHVVTDAGGQVVALQPYPWDLTSVVQLPGDRIAFDVNGPRDLRTRRLLMGETFHLKDRCDGDETVGVSRLQRCAGSIGQAQALAEFTGSMWRNGVNPSGTIEIEGKLGPEAFEQLRERWRQLYQGPSNAARAVVLDQGAKFKPISVSPEDAELLMSRKFSGEEICRIFAVPPPIVQNYENNTFTNSQTASQWFGQLTLLPWVKKIEAEFARSVFGEGERDLSIEFDLSGLL
jgi:HK97 family phage portal protein